MLSSFKQIFSLIMFKTQRNINYTDANFISTCRNKSQHKAEASSSCLICIYRRSSFSNQCIK